MPATAPGMATAQALEREPRTAHGAVLSHRFRRILRAAGFKAANGSARQRREHRRNGPAIKSQEQEQNVLQRVHLINERRLAQEPEVIAFHGGEGLPDNGGSCNQNDILWHPQHVLMQEHALRTSRRQRLRMTALPSLRVVITAKRDELPGGSSCQFRTKQPLASLWPCCLRRAKSARCRSRMARVSLSRAGGFMPRWVSAEPDPFAGGA